MIDMGARSGRQEKLGYCGHVAWRLGWSAIFEERITFIQRTGFSSNSMHRRVETHADMDGWIVIWKSDALTVRWFLVSELLICIRVGVYWESAIEDSCSERWKVGVIRTFSCSLLGDTIVAIIIIRYIITSSLNWPRRGSWWMALLL